MLSILFYPRVESSTFLQIVGEFQPNSAKLKTEHNTSLNHCCENFKSNKQKAKVDVCGSHGCSLIISILKIFHLYEPAWEPETVNISEPSGK
jgi:hypothetical protein